MSGSININNINESLPIDKYIHVVAICNNLALLVSQCTMKQFLQRMVLLSQLQECWTKGREVYLKLGPEVSDESQLAEYNEADEEEDIKPILPIISTEFDELESTISHVDNNEVGLASKRQSSKSMEDDYVYDNDDDDAVTIDNNIDEDTIYDEDYIPNSGRGKSRRSVKLSARGRPRAAAPSTSARGCAVATRSSYVRSADAKFRSGKSNDDENNDGESDDGTLLVDNRGAEESTSCPKCTEQFETTAALRAHVKQKHARNDKKMTSLANSKCERTISGGTSNYNQTRDKSLEKCGSFDRKQVKNSISGLSVVAKHLNLDFRIIDDPATDEYNSSKLFACQHCSRQFSHEYLAVRHAEIEHKVYECSKPYTFNNVNRSFPSGSSKSVPKKIISPQVQNSESDNNIRKNIAPVKKLKSLLCSICGRCFALKETLRCHMYVHTGEKPFKCELCVKAFRQRTQLLSHVQAVHIGFKPHMCSVCGLRFVSSSLLNYHLRIHSGERPFGCNVCGKRFRVSKYLTRHLRSHSKQRNYSCQLCVAKYKDRESVRRHMKVHSKTYTNSGSRDLKQAL